MFFLFRNWIPSSSLTSTARAVIKSEREEDIERLDHKSREKFFNLPLSNPGVGVLLDPRYNQDVLPTSIYGKFRPHSTRYDLKVDDDEEDMKQSRLERKSYMLPCLPNIKFPEGQKTIMPALDLLHATIEGEAGIGWTQPSPGKLERLKLNRWSDETTLARIKPSIEEYTIGCITEESGNRLRNKIESCMDDDKVYLPSNALAMATGKFQMRRTDWRDIVQASVKERFSKETYSPRIPGHNECQEELAWFMFGNGLDWMVVLRFPYFWVKSDKNKHYYHIKRRCLGKGDKIILDKLADIGVAYGVGILDDLEKIVQTLKDLYQYDWISPKGLDISTVMVAAGFHFNNLDMTTLCYVLLGTVVNNRVEKMDGKWLIPMKEVSEDVLCWAVDKLMSGFSMMAVCFTLFFREVFPDPALVRGALAVSEEHLKMFFMMVLAKTIGDRVPVDECLEKAGTNRAKRILQLTGQSKARPNTPDEGKMMQKLVDLIPLVPHVTFGGARYIEPVREQFVEVQLTVLRSLFPEAQSFRSITINLGSDLYDSEEWKQRVKFGHSSTKHIERYHPGTSGAGLMAHPSLADKVGTLVGVKSIPDVRRMRDRVIASRGCEPHTYSQAVAIEEAAWHCPMLVKQLMLNMNDAYWTQVEKTKNMQVKGRRGPQKPRADVNLYTRMANMYTLRTGLEDIRMPTWDDFIQTRHKNVVNHLKRSKMIDSCYEARLDLVEATVAGGSNAPMGQVCDVLGSAFKIYPQSEEARMAKEKKRPKWKKETNLEELGDISLEDISLEDEETLDDITVVIENEKGQEGFNNKENSEEIEERTVTFREDEPTEELNLEVEERVVRMREDEVDTPSIEFNLDMRPSSEMLERRQFGLEEQPITRVRSPSPEWLRKRNFNFTSWHKKLAEDYAESVNVKLVNAMFEKHLGTSHFEFVNNNLTVNDLVAIETVVKSENMKAYLSRYWEEADDKFYDDLAKKVKVLWEKVHGPTRDDDLRQEDELEYGSPGFKEKGSATLRKSRGRSKSSAAKSARVKESSGSLDARSMKRPLNEDEFRVVDKMGDDSHHQQYSHERAKSRDLSPRKRPRSGCKLIRFDEKEH